MFSIKSDDSWSHCWMIAFLFLVDLFELAIARWGAGMVLQWTDLLLLQVNYEIKLTQDKWHLHHFSLFSNLFSRTVRGLWFGATEQIVFTGRSDDYSITKPSISAYAEKKHHNHLPPSSAWVRSLTPQKFVSKESMSDAFPVVTDTACATYAKLLRNGDCD